MPWLQLSFALPEARLATAEAVLEAAGAQAITLQDGADQPLFEPGPGETPLWRALRLQALLAPDTDTEALRAALTRALDGEPAGWRLEALPERAWERAWMDDFRPMRFGERLWICPSWAEPPAPEAVNLRLDPGLAFGTGTHPSTRLCLEWLDAHPPRDQEVIDYGCGSGVLGLAALALGARHVTGVDIEPQALEASRANARANGFDDARLTLCTPEALADRPADLLLANILAGPLIDLAPRLARLVRPGGTLVLAGILAEQADAVARAYQPWFNIGPPRHHEEWVRLTGRRHRGPAA